MHVYKVNIVYRQFSLSIQVLDTTVQFPKPLQGQVEIALNYHVNRFFFLQWIKSYFYKVK